MKSYLTRWFRSKQTLAEEIAEACQSVTGIQKLGEHEDLKYPYLRIVDLSNALRGELFRRGIIILPNDLGCVHETFDTSIPDRLVTEYRVRTEFTVTNGRERLVYCSFGVGRDVDGKALFIAQTGALKAFLKRLGLIFGEADDPEVSGERNVSRREDSSYQSRAWNSALKFCGKTAEQIETYLSTEFGFDVTSESITSLPRKQFDLAMQWLMQNGNLAETLTTSVEAVRAKKSTEKVI